MTKQHVDIFEIINKLQNKDRAVLDQDQQAAPFVLQRWLSGVKDELQILLINDVSNPHLFNLSSHPKLIHSLLLSSTSRQNNRCRWFKQSPSKITNQLALTAICRYYDITIKDAKKYSEWMTNDEILSAATFVGMQPDEIKQLRKQLKLN